MVELGYSRSAMSGKDGCPRVPTVFCRYLPHGGSEPSETAISTRVEFLHQCDVYIPSVEDVVKLGKDACLAPVLWRMFSSSVHFRVY